MIQAYRLTRDEKWLNWLAKVDAYTFEHFVDEEYGEWFGYCDRQGNLIHTAKGGNYKGFFHVSRCLIMSVQAIDSIEFGSTK